MPKKVQIRRIVSAVEFKRATIDKEITFFFFEVPVRADLEYAMVRVEMEDYPQYYVRCPVKLFFKGIGTKVGTLVADIPAGEIARLEAGKNAKPSQ